MPENLKKLISKIAKELKAKNYVEKYHNPRTPSGSKTQSSKSSKTRYYSNYQTQKLKQENVKMLVDPKKRSKRNIFDQHVVINDDEMDKKEAVSLETALKNLEMGIDKMFVDIVDGMEVKVDEEAYDEMNAKAINNLKIFSIEEVVPSHLLLDTNDDNQQQIVINEALFQMMSREDIDGIDEIALDIRDAIISSCEISVN